MREAVLKPLGLSLLGVALLVGSGFPVGPVYAKSQEKQRTSKLRVASQSKKQNVGVQQQQAQDKFSAQAQRLLSKTSGLDKQVLELALVAHGNAVRNGKTNKQILTVVDYSKPSTHKRLWVFDLSSEDLLFHEYVAHGVNSGGKYTQRFSNEPGSKASSYGVFLAAETYSGQHGYSMRLDGLEQNLNDNARERAIVMHGGSYVSQAAINTIGRLGRSWGCFTLRSAVTKPIINTVKNKTVIFAYYPNFKWLATSKYLNKKALL